MCAIFLLGAIRVLYRKHACCIDFDYWTSSLYLVEVYASRFICNCYMRPILSPGPSIQYMLWEVVHAQYCVHFFPLLCVSHLTGYVPADVD